LDSDLSANPTPQAPALTRRGFLRTAAVAGASLASGGLLGACAAPTASQPVGLSGAPALINRGETIKLGIIPLTDCASVVMAHELGLYRQNGVNVEISREASWANVRDKLLTGELQGAHCLFGMPFSVYTGVGGTAGKELYITMVLNNNGQAITLSKDFCGSVGFRETGKVAAAVDTLKSRKEVTFAGTFPGGTHDLWLRYWLAAAGVDQKTVKVITIPPPQMVANMKVGNMDGFCVGEPWGGVAAQEGIGFTHISTQDLWKHHPEKALVVNKEFHDGRRDEMKAVMRSVLEASAWLDNLENRKRAAPVIGQNAYVNAPPEIIDGRLEGNYAIGCNYGDARYTDDYMLFSNNGTTNLPRKAHGIWFLTQYVRFGYLQQPPAYQAIADLLIKQDLYREVAQSMNVPVPDDDMKPFTVQLDGAVFDPGDPVAYLRTYPPV
jgi:nitrate/nitrite transport system substrate-binding protein